MENPITKIEELERLGLLVLHERRAKLEAHVAMFKTNLDRAAAELEKVKSDCISKLEGLATKYGTDVKDAIDLETGAIIRKVDEVKAKL